jgi:hypothetical protein
MPMPMDSNFSANDLAFETDFKKKLDNKPSPNIEVDE